MSFSIFRDLVEDTAEQRRNFFKLVFGSSVTGWVCISYVFMHEGKKKETHKFFEWPNQLEEMLENISSHSQELVHAYFCPNLYESPEKSKGHKDKSYVKTCTNIWADLDTCNPALMKVPPSIVTQTSPGKFHALWLLLDPVEPHIAEDISLRIAYFHADQGADKSGHDLSQLLRIPYTPNFKYGDIDTAPIVTVIEASKKLYRPSQFDVYPHVEAIKSLVTTEVPDNVRNARDIIQGYSLDLNDTFIRLYTTMPEHDWSGQLWAFILKCSELGVPREEAFILANSAACNKYVRDGRPETDTWAEVNRAYIRNAEIKHLIPTSSSTIPELITKEEIEIVQKRETFIERYMKWAVTITDASKQYHQSGAFMILSALLSGSIVLPTSFGRMVPNLWFMILGNTTITRKTTAMNMAMKLLYDVDSRALLATDGSLEGILVGMRDRPKQPSIFLRDEFSGLLEIIAHKDYMAGFAEQLTKLYDGEQVKRLLRKEVIDIHDPVFIMYVGGPKFKTQSLITEDLVMGGFLPRFIIITAEPDLDSIRPMGPPLTDKQEEREIIKNELIDLFNHYVKENTVTRNGESLGKLQAEYEVALTPQAWTRYNEFETLMIKTALDTGLDYLTPVYDRLSKSTLKAAMLIAASTQRSDRVIVGVNDILHAIFYARQWREYASEIVNGIGKSYDERLIDRIAAFVATSRLGVPRDEIMNMFRLDVKKADLLLRTMEQRRLLVLIEGRYKAK